MERKKLIITVVSIVGCGLVIGGIFLILWATGVFSSGDSNPPIETTTNNPTDLTISTTRRPLSPYIAAVVEYKKLIDEDPDRETNLNTIEYVSTINSEEVVNSDIIIFPEGGLNNLLTAQLVPEVELGIVPCTHPDYRDSSLAQISCAAERKRVYVVVNLIEKSTCPDAQQIRLNDPRPCSESGINHYNTNVVFDRTGKVVAKYRKYNLLNEPGNLQPYKPETSTFTMDNGHTFGLLTSSDILFKSPAYDLVKQGITNFIAPSIWFNELPYLTAIQTQRAWALTHNVNLLVAGLSNPATGNSGSGIYHGDRGAQRYSINGVAKTEVLKSGVPAIGSGGFPSFERNDKTPDEMSGLSIFKDQVENYKGQLIVGESAFNLCHESLCCYFDIRGSFTQRTGKYYEYYAFVYDGMRSLRGASDVHVKLCGIAACTSMDQKTCGDRFPAGTIVEERVTFNSIAIEGDFKEEEDGELLMLPSAVDTSISHYGAGSMNYKFDEESKKHGMYLTFRTKDLLGFGLYGILYETK